MKFRITSEFGALEEFRGTPHTGVDIGTPTGTEIHSIASGVIDKVFPGSGDIGKGVIVKLHDGTRHIYGHFKDVSVSVGDKITPGELLGHSGATGNVTGPHLHFSVMNKAGEFIDPSPLIGKVDAMAGTISPAWYDIDGRIDAAINAAMDNLQQSMEDVIVTALKAILNVTLDLSYAVTLVGGGILIILFGVTQYKKFGIWAGTLFTVNALLKLLFVGVRE